MAHFKLEAQANSVRNVLNKFGISKSDRAHLEEAASVLDALARLREKCMRAAEQPDPERLSEEITEEILRLLHLPSGA